MTAPRRVLLADADAFYVSVARLVDPDGAGKTPLLIVGGSQEGRGVVTSASYECRKYGVTSAIPTARALRLCPGALVVPVPMEACAEKGREIRNVLQRFTPIVEQASIDEFYLDLSGTERLYCDEPLELTARTIRDAVRETTGLGVSIGGAVSKIVAKMAAGVAKPRPGGEAGPGVVIVPPGGEIEFLRRFQLADIPGVGPRFQARLAEQGLVSVADALQLDLPALTARLGRNPAAWLYDRIRGIDQARVYSRDARSLSRDETFGADIDDDGLLDRKLVRLVDRATSDLRHAGLLARTVTVRLRDADFVDRQASRTVPEPIAAFRPALSVARRLLGRLREARRTPARLIGVALSSLAFQDGPVQLSLFSSPGGDVRDTERDKALSQAVDRLRERFGYTAIARGRTRSRGERPRS